ncbi:hypothetical protein [Bifidobacterium sp. ESL0790]|uniref:hypothetical protein n=1 Tax=Bifidobacterium sp. ESL0790 TaxID=2983233 RepID=UPI0023F7A127|nr:hypothetical protein [Bifidobacterium sp. ESL0790]WEV72146.1 hypothetical protein OZY47_06815 [Bifidobacterium sp. ESL0790]
MKDAYGMVISDGKRYRPEDAEKLGIKEDDPKDPPTKDTEDTPKDPPADPDKPGGDQNKDGDAASTKEVPAPDSTKTKSPKSAK